MRFYELHPCVTLLYFIAGLCFVAFTQNPILLCIAFVCAFGYSVLNLSFAKTLKFTVSLLPIMLLISVIMPLFNHRGNTVLFVLSSGNLFTLESVIYSLCGALTLGCVLLWFKACEPLLSSDNIYVVFGKISPHLALFFTMALQFIPKITHNFKSAYRLKSSSKSGFSAKIRVIGSCMTSCISLSLEDSVKTVQSMKSRGYGTKRRTFYSPKNFRTVDYISLLVILALLILVIFAFNNGQFECAFYPLFSVRFSDASVLGYALYFLYFAAAYIFDLCGVIMWKVLRQVR